MNGSDHRSLLTIKRREELRREILKSLNEHKRGVTINQLHHVAKNRSLRPILMELVRSGKVRKTRSLGPHGIVRFLYILNKSSETA
jgi:hypothetical protein